MKLVRHLVVAAALVAPTLVAVVGAQDSKEARAQQPAVPSQEDMAAMLAQAERFTAPGPEHAFLGLLVGEWDVESRFTMMGANAPAQPGKAVTRWKIEGRVIESEYEGQLMGMPLEQFSIMGYDRMKQSFVWTGCNSSDTAMNHAEGDMTPDGNALVLWGTLDEYLTGEHDKMVKYVHHFRGQRGEDGAWSSIDGMTLEVHDMAIGLENTKVLEFTYTRAE